MRPARQFLPRPLPAALSRPSLAACLLLALAGAARAQDSVSTAPGLPGDAPSAYAIGAAGEQVNDYVVDLSTRVSSWGNAFAYGPAMKASASSVQTAGSGFFNHLIASQVVSNRFTSPQALLRPAYAQWSGAGQGVTAGRNSAPAQSIAAAGLTAQSFGLAFMEFAGGPNNVFGDGDDENNVIAGVVAVQNRGEPRLFVSRAVAAVNRPAAAAGNLSTASFGLGGVDEAGNVHLLADGFTAQGADPIANKRLIRVDASLRTNTAINQLRGAGPTDTAATRTLLAVTTTQTTPTILPKGVAGRPIMLAADFANAYLYEGVANATTSTTAHLPAGHSARGPLTAITRTFTPAGGTLGLAGALARGPSATKTRHLAVWGLASSGAPATPLAFELPTAAGAILDRDDNFDPAAAWGSLGNQEFTNYGSQVCFRGGNGPLALTVLPGGDLLLAAGVAATGGAATIPQSQDGYIAVARVPAGGGDPTWTLAAHTGGPVGLGKRLFSTDGSGTFTPIGRIVRLADAQPGVAGGPSISAPAIDLAGNVYFMAAIRLDGPPVVNTIGLVRANFDPATNAYKLELLARIGDVLPGRNAGRNYQIQFLSTADGDSVDSGSVWSSSIVQDTIAGVDPATLPYGSPLALGALVFRAKIVYDYDQLGDFVDSTQNGGPGTGPDQAYNVAMVVVPALSIADIVGIGGFPPADGQLTVDDYTSFINAFAGEDLLADIVSIGGFPPSDGELTVDDYTSFINAFAAN